MRLSCTGDMQQAGVDMRKARPSPRGAFLSIFPLHTWTRLAGCQTSLPGRERGAPAGGKWEGLPGAAAPCTVLHELASSSLPSGHGLISATGIYREVEKRKETARISCVCDLMEFLPAHGVLPRVGAQVAFLPLTFKNRQIFFPVSCKDSFRPCSVLQTFTPWPQC